MSMDLWSFLGVKAVFLSKFLFEDGLKVKKFENHYRYKFKTKIELKLLALSPGICKKVDFENFGVKAVLFWHGDIICLLTIIFYT